jgi:hypothetical protein
MITGTHALIHSDHAEEIRAFFRDILKLPSVDAGHGWLIFSLPPAEIGMHPAEKGSHYELYLLCDDINSTVADLEKRGVRFSSPITDARFGFVTSLTLPGGAELGLYQPNTLLPHPGPRRKRYELALPESAPKPKQAANAADKSSVGAISAYCHPLPDAPIISVHRLECGWAKVCSSRSTLLR